MLSRPFTRCSGSARKGTSEERKDAQSEATNGTGTATAHAEGTHPGALQLERTGVNAAGGWCERERRIRTEAGTKAGDELNESEKGSVTEPGVGPADWAERKEGQGKATDGMMAAPRPRRRGPPRSDPA